MDTCLYSLVHCGGLDFDFDFVVLWSFGTVKKPFFLALIFVVCVISTILHVTWFDSECNLPNNGGIGYFVVCCILSICVIFLMVVVFSCWLFWYLIFLCAIYCYVFEGIFPVIWLIFDILSQSSHHYILSLLWRILCGTFISWQSNLKSSYPLALLLLFRVLSWIEVVEGRSWSVCDVIKEG